MLLIGIWLTSAVVLPGGIRILLDRVVSVPDGAEILLLQRETVNDAWDLPREVTMEAFFATHRQWAGYKPVESAFEWQWYYAFQQVGDQTASALSNAYIEGRARRDQLAGWASVLAPPALLQRILEGVAATDTKASLEYEESVRQYHLALRHYYYPKLFQNESFDKALLENLPVFQPD